VTSLVFGLIFLGVAGLWALVQGDLLSLPNASVLGPAVLVVAGLAGIAVTLRRGSRGNREGHDPRTSSSGSTSSPSRDVRGQTEGGSGRR
jgi:hypothetical protein